MIRESPARNSSRGVSRSTRNLRFTGPDPLVYTIGSLFTPSPALVGIIERLERVAASDPTVSLVPRSSLHFTFLALTPHTWDNLQEMPSPQGYANVVARHLGGVAAESPFLLTDLRLLPLSNALPLAGIPTADTFNTGVRLISDLVHHADMEKQLRARSGAMFPPLFWRTTLRRARTALCPRAIRNIFAEHRERRFGSLRLDTPRLMAVDFDWSRREAVAGR